MFQNLQVQEDSAYQKRGNIHYVLFNIQDTKNHSMGGGKKQAWV